MNYKVYNEDCIGGLKNHVENESVNLIFTDPPFAIEGDKLDKHYARQESNVVPGYVDIPASEYAEFSEKWIKECERVLRPGGSMYIVSGYTGLRDILNSLYKTSLVEENHLVAQYTFAVSTVKKWVSSHYHVLYYVKPPLSKKTFNTYCRYSDIGDSYKDRLSIQELKRKYKPGQVKNKNQLPEDFIEKFIFYSSNRGDVILDPFCGGFSTGRVALAYGREFIGFEINKNAFDVFRHTLDDVFLMDDPLPINPSSEVMEERKKKRQGYKKARERRKSLKSST